MKMRQRRKTKHQQFVHPAYRRNRWLHKLKPYIGAMAASLGVSLRKLSEAYKQTSYASARLALDIESADQQSALKSRFPWWDTPHDDEEFPSLAMPRTTTFTRPYHRAVLPKMLDTSDQTMKKFYTAAREPISNAELGRLMLGIPYTVIRPDLPIDPPKD